jgi:starch phosphorylase
MHAAWRLDMSATSVDFFSQTTALENSADWVHPIQAQLRNRFAKNVRNATRDELFRAVAEVMRPKIVDALLATEGRFSARNAKTVCYLSLEFLLGRSLMGNLLNLGLLDAFQAALSTLGVDLADLAEAEPDAALGNGGLGRLAACFLDSLATLHMPAIGYGINYQFGLFRQDIEDGFQKERPDFWASEQSPWLIKHPDQAVVVPIYGRVDHAVDRHGNYNPMWMDWNVLIGVPHDLPIVGRGGRTVNTLRLYSAQASHHFDMQIFNAGDYLSAVEQKIESETVSKVLYPSDAQTQGRYLRLTQEYFLVACAIRDIFRRLAANGKGPEDFAGQIAIQMNDTHPALAVAELMRMLVDEHDIGWDRAWEITVAACGYTNHTLMPEALEKWPVEMLDRLLPRHLQIIYEINHRFLERVTERWPNDTARLQRMSIIEEEPVKKARMANLAVIGSHAVNGVAALHSQLVKTELIPDFHEFYPSRISNKTNGVSPRRWLMYANPALSSWITQRIGNRWQDNLDRLRDLEPFASDPPSLEEFRSVKQRNKQRLADRIAQLTGESVDPSSLFDVQVKRIHEYKRQLLHALGIIDEYLGIVDDGVVPAVPRVHILAGKAAPGYFMAKLIIKLIHNIAAVINSDPRARDRLRVVFLPDYKVSLAELIIPAADLSQQISTAGMEASGTSNMKFALNGALTIGTMDGANIEILEEVGQENIFIFGLRAEEIRALRTRGYHPWDFYHANPRIRRVVDSLTCGRFSSSEPGIFQPIRRALLDDGDPYFHLADFASYGNAQQGAADTYRDVATWNRKAILNVARMGKFSSDRTIREYAGEIWGIQSIPPSDLVSLEQPPAKENFSAVLP